MEKINQIHNIDILNKCVEVDAGVKIDDLNTSLEKDGFFSFRDGFYRI